MSLNLAYVQSALLILASDDLITNALSAQTNTGMVGALLTPENQQYAKQLRLANNDGTGHLKQIRVATKQRRTKADQPNLQMDGCVFGNEMPYIEETVTINEQVAESFTISEAQIRLYPALVSQLQTITGANIPRKMVEIGRNSEAGRQVIQAIREITLNLNLSMDSLTQKINTKLVTDFITKVGKWKGGAVSKTYAVQYPIAYASGGGSVNAGELLRYKQDMRMQMLPGNTHTISGFGAMDRVFAQDATYFGQGANGIDYGSLVTNSGLVTRHFVDENIVGITGSENNALIFKPGSATFLQYVKYTGTFGDIGTMLRFSMPHPLVPGLMLDVKIYPNECDELYQIKFGVYFELYIPEMDLFKATDQLAGVNGTFQASFTQA